MYEFSYIFMDTADQKVVLNRLTDSHLTIIDRVGIRIKDRGLALGLGFGTRVRFTDPVSRSTKSSHRSSFFRISGSVKPAI